MTAGIALGELADRPEPRPSRGVRIVLDVRPLQDPEHAPVTAAYLHGLLSALDAEPLAGETFVFLLAAERDDPTVRYERLAVVGRRHLPPVRLLGAARAAVDPFVVRGAVTGAGWRPERTGSGGAVHHTTSAALPFGSELPVTVALLDLAPWELPALRRRGGPAGYGRRLRARLVGEAAGVLVGTSAIARRAQRLLRVPVERMHVVPLAPTTRAPAPPWMASQTDEAAQAAPDGSEAPQAADASEAARLGLAGRFVALALRYDARHDPATALAALARLAEREDRATRAEEPFAVVVGASPEDRAALARLAAREGIGERIAYAPALPPDRLRALLAASRAVALPAAADAAGLGVLDAFDAGVPVVATSVGALPELVGPAGILVPAHDAVRLAAALGAVLDDDTTHAALAAAVADRRETLATWSDVAWATRRIWAEVARRPRLR